MTDTTTDNFWQIWNSFEWPDPAPIFYRLYYDSEGWPICYSMEDLPHAYVEISAEQFAIADAQVRVIEGQIQSVKSSPQARKLRPFSQGTPCDTRDVCVVVREDQPHVRWELHL